MKLLGERILVKELPSDSKIILPDKVMTEDITKGEVIAIGNKVSEGSGCEDIVKGDIIQWNVHAGTWTEINGSIVCILRMNDVVCILGKKSIIQKVIN